MFKFPESHLNLRWIVLLFFILSTVICYSQENKQTSEEIDNVEETFQSPIICNNQTVDLVKKNELEISYLQRFGVIKNEIDMFGLFAQDNFRLGIDYGLLKGVSIGVGSTKNKNILDFNAKMVLLNQNKSGSKPFTIALFGEASRSGMNRNNFLNQNSEYFPENRLSYFSELMVAHKFNEEFSLQTALTFSYFNLIEPERDNSNFGISVVSRYKICQQTSVIFDFDYSLTQPDINPPKPNLGFGLEFTSKTNALQLFITTCDAVVNGEFRVFNQNVFVKGDMLLGFNISHKFDFRK